MASAQRTTAPAWHRASSWSSGGRRSGTMDRLPVSQRKRYHRARNIATALEVLGRCHDDIHCLSDAHQISIDRLGCLPPVRAPLHYQQVQVAASGRFTPPARSEQNHPLRGAASTIRSATRAKTSSSPDPACPGAPPKTLCIQAVIAHFNALLCSISNHMAKKRDWRPAMIAKKHAKALIEGIVPRAPHAQSMRTVRGTAATRSVNASA